METSKDDQAMQLCSHAMAMPCMTMYLKCPLNTSSKKTTLTRRLLLLLLGTLPEKNKENIWKLSHSQSLKIPYPLYFRCVAFVEPLQAIVYPLSPIPCQVPQWVYNNIAMAVQHLFEMAPNQN